MGPDPKNPLVVQSDRSLLLEVHHPLYEAARDAIGAFAELEKSPEHIHTYRLSALSLWNAAAAGVSPDSVCDALSRFAKYPVPKNVITDIQAWMERFGTLRLLPGDEALRLEVDDPHVVTEICRHPDTRDLIDERDGGLWVPRIHRGALKQRLARMGYPVDDRIALAPGQTLKFSLRAATRQGEEFSLRSYQQHAIDLFLGGGQGHGVVVLPCGSGKTLVGIGIAAALESEVLIVCTSVTAARQWVRELLDRTDLSPDYVGEYSGAKKEIRPITVTTYQMIAYRKGQTFPHFALFTERDWGLVIYDEVHLLPAPVFRITAEIQSRRRLGLTATLVREDGLETDVFSLVGPQRFSAPWKDLETLGFIAQAECHELRVSMPEARKAQYAASADQRHRRFRLAAENPRKTIVVRELLARHEDDRILIIGQYVSQLEELARALGLPLITGRVAQREREKLFAEFRSGLHHGLVISRIGNASIDLPEASVCIQVSGTFGSRQEEAQRLGRILRPKKKAARFYSLVSKDTIEMTYAMNRQRFLTEQGYGYQIEYRERFEGSESTAPSTVPALAEVISIDRVRSRGH